MKILLDTNVLIAAFITRGICSELLEHYLRHHQIVRSCLNGSAEMQMMIKFLELP